MPCSAVSSAAVPGQRPVARCRHAGLQDIDQDDPQLAHPVAGGAVLVAVGAAPVAGCVAPVAVGAAAAGVEPAAGGVRRAAGPLAHDF